MDNLINRRDFLYKLGIRTSLTIAGFFTFNKLLSDQGEDISKLENQVSDIPCLIADVRKDYENGHFVLSGKSSKCFANETGEKIIDWIDGKNTLPDITFNLSEYYSIDNTESLEASVATFICQLATMGFLTSPFYVTLYETY